jgi:hypothetical protein
MDEHPDDADAYALFAELIGWDIGWGCLNTWRDVPGPGKAPFVAAFRLVRERAAGALCAGGDTFTAGLVDHWGEWVAKRERQRAEARPKRRVRKKPTP